ncbi:heterokaryon incompatibility protein-domain-containing protein [Bisporella sp. PMI_857]|nr:heterokaryon incompatibility protein-domain-containing protein [Bisporella sp. PMI_857]
METDSIKELYAPLALAAGQFRLITVYPRFSPPKDTAQPHNELPLRCDLYNASRGGSDQYQALSYTWGDAKDTVPLLVNGIEIPVTRNLRVALDYIRDDYTNSTFWIDALSINQTDEGEKTEQVKHMKGIYVNASSTRAWLGLPDNHSDDVIAELDRVGKSIVSTGTLELLIELASLSGENTELYQSLETKINDRLAGFFEMALQDLARTQSLITAVQAFFSREYWNRVWILQEIVVSPNIRIQCGNSNILFPNFYAGFFYVTMMKVYVISKLSPQVTHLVELPPRGDTKELFVHFQAIATAGFSPSAAKIFGMRRRYQLLSDNQSTPETTNTLAQILARICVTGARKASSHATDDKDKIFALLGMASDGDSLGIVANYSMSCSSAYIMAARKIIMSGQVDLLSLSQLRSRSADLPSWVPDWRAEWILRPSGQLPWDTAFSASGDSVLQVRADVGTSPSQLTLNGYLVGRVETLGKAWEPHLIDGCVKDTPGVAAYLLDVANLCILSDLKFRDTHFSIYTNNDHRRQAHIRVPIADQEGYGINSIRRATQECHQGYREVLEATKDSIDYLLGREAAEPVKIPTNSNAKVSYLDMLGWQRDRKPFLADNGYVGLAPSHVEKDDVIVIFLGGKFPYVLREKENGAFTFVELQEEVKVLDRSRNAECRVRQYESEGTKMAHVPNPP